MSERFISVERTPNEDIVSNARTTMRFGQVSVSGFGQDKTVLISHASANGLVSGMMHLSKDEALDLAAMLKTVAGDLDA